MANKRTYELDEQATYSSTLRLLVDDSGFSEAKYQDAGVLAPKIQTEDTIANGSVNTTSFLLRLNDGSGGEYQKTIDDFIDLFTENYNVSLTAFLYNVSGDIKGKLSLRRFWKQVNGIFVVNVGSGTGTSTEQLYTDQTGQAESVLELPSTLWPTSRIRCSNSTGSNDFNTLEIATNGTVYARTSVVASIPAIPISYITN